MKAGKRIPDDHPLLRWLHDSAVRCYPREKLVQMERQQIKEEQDEHGENPLAQFGEKVWFPRVGEDVDSTDA